MGTRDKRVDAYIAKSAEFAQPILKRLRAIVHKGCPEVEETIKWGFPHFQYHGILCSMAAFKEHCAFGFWKASLMQDSNSILSRMGKSAMGNFGRITKTSELPPDRILITYIEEAMRLNQDGIKVAKKRVTGPRELIVPEFFMEALRKNKKALKAFEEYSYSHKKEYVEYVTEAKKEETRTRRMAQTVALLAQGKTRNWKYERS